MSKTAECRALHLFQEHKNGNNFGSSVFPLIGWACAAPCSNPIRGWQQCKNARPKIVTSFLLLEYKISLVRRGSTFNGTYWSWKKVQINVMWASKDIHYHNLIRKDRHRDRHILYRCSVELLLSQLKIFLRKESRWTGTQWWHSRGDWQDVPLWGHRGVGEHGGHVGDGVAGDVRDLSRWWHRGLNPFLWMISDNSTFKQIIKRQNLYF